MRIKFLIISFALLAVTFCASAQNQWDGDNPTGNFSFCNNWYSDNCPSAWNGSTDLLFQFRNSLSQTSLFFNLGGWRDIRNLQFNSSYGQSTPLNGDGNGFNIFGKLENNSSYNQTINVPTHFRGSTVEINAVNADMVINSPVYNSNNRAINIFGPDGKLLTFNNYIEGNGSVALNINQYSKVAIASDMTGKSPAAFSGGVNINIGELWINTDSKLNGGTITLGGNNNFCKLYINATNGTQVSNPIIVANSANSTQIIGSFRTSGTNEYTGSVTLNRNVTLETAGGGTTIFTGVISGGNNVALNNLTGSGVATIVYNSATSNTYTGTTTINSRTRLRISSNQTLGNIALNGGTLEIDANVTLTITGAYTSTGGSIVNNGTIKFAGGPITFPGNATVNNGTANTLAGFEVASSGVVTLNTLLRVTNAITVSTGTLLLSSNDLRLNNAILNIASGATLDNGGENQIINDAGTPIINISGTFITRDAQGFVGSTTAIPSITPVLNIGSTIEYGRAGNQAVQGSIITTYQNITISGSGTKTLANTIPIAGTILTKDSAIFDVGSNTFGSGSTPLTMQGTSTYKVGGSGVKPDAGDLYTLATGTTMEFTGTSATQIRVAPSYANLVVSGTNVKAGSTDNAGLTFQNPGTITVKNGAVFKVTNTTGFTGSATAAIKITSSPTIILEAGSTVEYAGANQTITLVPVTTAYANLTVSGTGTKTIPTQLFVGNNLAVNTSTLRIESGKVLTVTNSVNVNAAATMTINDSGSLVQINDVAVNTGNISYERNYTGILPFDYTYWSSPVASQILLALSPTTKTDKFFSFDAGTNDWLQENPSTRTMEFGIGYIIRAAPVTGGQVGFLTNTFIGIPQNGARSITGLIADKSYLLGNPYPSALNAEKFLNDNAGVLNGTLYFWTHSADIQLYTAIIDAGGTPGTGVLAYTSDDYAAYNATGGLAVTQRDINPKTGLPYPGSSPSGSIAPTGKIASGQGFFASTKTTLSGSPIQILYNNSMRVGVANVLNENNSDFFKTRNPKTKTTTKHRIWLNLRNTQGLFKQTLIGYLTDATNQYDNRFDGETFDANEFADFYSVNQDKNLVIQGRALPFDENDEVPLGFRTKIDGDFTINIDQTDGILTNQSVFIEDKLINTIFDLRSGPYTFTTKAGTFNDRFVLRYTNKTLGISDFATLENQVLVSNKNKQIKVNSAVEIIDKVTIYDLLGRQLFKKEKVNSNELAIPNLVSSQQTLLVKVILQNGQTVTKKIMY